MPNHRGSPDASITVGSPRCSRIWAIMSSSFMERQASSRWVNPPPASPVLREDARREITRLRGELSLDFLADMSVVDARRWLEELPGVGPKTSAATLLFSQLRMPALPVDSHHHRVAQRLGLIPDSVDVGPAHAILEAQLPPALTAQEVYDNHEVLMLHGQRCCYHRAPACGRCVIFALCPTGQQLHPELVSPTVAEPRSA